VTTTHRGVPIPAHLEYLLKHVPDEIQKALTATDLVARMCEADALEQQAADARLRRNGVMATAYSTRADKVLAAPVNTAANRAEVGELMAKAEGATGALQQGYLERAEQLTAGSSDERWPAEARRLVGSAGNARRGVTIKK